MTRATRATLQAETRGDNAKSLTRPRSSGSLQQIPRVIFCDAGGHEGYILFIAACEPMRTKRPALRGTKWLGTIPVEAECTACAGVKFKAVFESHRPSQDEAMRSLQQQFDEHFQQAHAAQVSGDSLP